MCMLVSYQGKGEGKREEGGTGGSVGEMRGNRGIRKRSCGAGGIAGQTGG